MSKQYDEAAFEDEIAAALLKRGYTRVPSDDFDAERGIFPDEVVSFVQETQPEAWKQLETAHKGSARERFLQELTSALERQGTLELLRHGLRTPAPKSSSRRSNQTRESIPNCRLAMKRIVSVSPSSSTTRRRIRS